MASRHAGDGVAQPRESARARILDTAYELFSRHGIRAVGIDRIIAEAHIAKATLYRHFASKEELVIAFLDMRERRWTHEWLETRTQQLAPRPEDRMLSVFDAFDEWFHRSDYEGCSFINTLLEVDESGNPIHREAVRHLGVLRETVQRFAEQAGAQNPQEMSYQMQILMMGAIVSASRGDLEAARRARVFAELLLRAQPDARGSFIRPI
jgi:AcrR family transcriptional regulator